MIVLAIAFFVLAVAGGVASHVLSHAARHVATDGPYDFPFSALIGWAAFCQAVFFVAFLAGAAFLLAHGEGWK